MSTTSSKKLPRNKTREWVLVTNFGILLTTLCIIQGVSIANDLRKWEFGESMFFFIELLLGISLMIYGMINVIFFRLTSLSATTTKEQS